MSIFQSLLEIILFLFAIVVCFYLPGKYLFTKLKLTFGSPEDLFLPFCLGIMLFTLISYIFSWLKLEIIILPLFLMVSFFAIKGKKIFPKNIDKFHRWPLLVVVALSIIFSLSVLTSGVYGDTIKYGRDDLWHLALINGSRSYFKTPRHSGDPSADGDSRIRWRCWTSQHDGHEFRSCHSDQPAGGEESLANARLKQVQRSFVVSLLRMTGSAKLVTVLKWVLIKESQSCYFS